MLQYIHFSERICFEQEKPETLVLAGHNYDGVGLTLQLWHYWTLEAELLSWDS